MYCKKTIHESPLSTTGQFCLLRAVMTQMAPSGASTVCFRALESFTGGGVIDTTATSNSEEYRYLLTVAALAGASAAPAECTFDLFVPGIWKLKAHNVHLKHFMSDCE